MAAASPLANGKCYQEHSIISMHPNASSKEARHKHRLCHKLRFSIL